VQRGIDLNRDLLFNFISFCLRRPGVLTVQLARKLRSSSSGPPPTPPTHSSAGAGSGKGQGHHHVQSVHMTLMGGGVYDREEATHNSQCHAIYL